ncbi:hypothetical protein DQ04_03561000 [Trypanosoma grayi]|uniref:hypothetical protein n=1 Tax=Trypanosoma grayi TaxID=71804 RepID=UPI0004F430B8|nr:hypothetical protein DQ04_03561000 [Trypanosoma grayi]KEG10562.1 hypothetical protein DQ04_03561000 [Trypanosoma grayi]
MAIGFSNGAMMVEVLACHKPTVFRAVASVSGIVELRPGNDAGLEACGRAILVNNTEGLRTSVLMVHGNHDMLVPVGGNSFLGFPPLQDNVAGWANFNGCNEATDVTINASRYRNLIYSDCDSGADVWETRVRRYVRRIKDVVVGHLTGRHAADLRHSVVEIVHALQGGHEWPEDDEFSTTDYVHAFGARVFSGY